MAGIIVDGEILYGEWIKPCGGRIILNELCSHLQHISYERADDEGWVAIVYDGAGVSVRLNPERTSIKAFRTLETVIKEYNDRVFIEDVFSGTIPGIPWEVTSREALKLVREWKVNIQNALF